MMYAAIQQELFGNTRAQMRGLGIPDRDMWTPPLSERRFDDGAWFRIEIPTVNSAAAVDAVLTEANRLGVHINRITETLGVFRHTAAEIREMVDLCTDYGCQLVMSPGPRATYDTSASAQSAQGSRMGYRLRGQEQLVRAVEDIKRACDLGVRGFVIYDEGLLWVLDEMRMCDALPGDLHIKVSAHCGHGNAASCKMLEKLGADSINPVRDLQLGMLAAIRAAVGVPLDCHTDNPAASGGFIRFYEAPEFVRLLAPVYLKAGNSAVGEHGHTTSVTQARQMARQAGIVREIIGTHLPEAVQSPSAQATTELTTAAGAEA